MITTVPADVPRTKPLPSEAFVAPVFRNRVSYEATMRRQFAARLFDITRVFIGKDLHKAKTLIDHFAFVWALHPADYIKY